jgi:hypothetical protein
MVIKGMAFTQSRVPNLGPDLVVPSGAFVPSTNAIHSSKTVARLGVRCGLR